MLTARVDAVQRSLNRFERSAISGRREQITASDDHTHKSRDHQTRCQSILSKAPALRTYNRIPMPREDAADILVSGCLHSAGCALTQMVCDEHGACRRKFMSFKFGKQTQHVSTAFNAVERSQRCLDSHRLADPLPGARRRCLLRLSSG